MGVTPANMSFSNRLLPAIALALCTLTVCHAQMPMPPLKAGGGYTGEVPQFDVISVKPHKPGEDMMMMHWGQSDYKVVNLTLKNMISNVYGVKSWLVYGLPPWAESSHWDMDAKVSSPDLAVMEKLTPEQRRVMIGGILKDRFGMVVHTESKVESVFVMTTLPGGIRSKASPPQPAGSDDDPRKLIRGSWRIGRGSLTASRMKLSSLAENLSYQVERTIVDKTGLTGEYDITLKWTPEDRANAGTDNGAGDTPPAIFEAIKEQLGLKLTADKAPVPTVVVDKIVQPEAD